MGPDNSQITFGLSGIDQGTARIIILVNGNEEVNKNIVIGEVPTATPTATPTASPTAPRSPEAAVRQEDRPVAEPPLRSLRTASPPHRSTALQRSPPPAMRSPG